MNNDEDRFKRVTNLFSERFVDDFVSDHLWNGCYPREINTVLDEYNRTKDDLLNQFSNKKIDDSFKKLNAAFSDLYIYLIHHFSIPRVHFKTEEHPSTYYLEPQYHHNFFMSERGSGANVSGDERSKKWDKFKSDLDVLGDNFHKAYMDFIRIARKELEVRVPWWKKPEIILGLIMLIIAIVSIPWWPSWFSKLRDNREESNNFMDSQKATDTTVILLPNDNFSTNNIEVKNSPNSINTIGQVGNNIIYDNSGRVLSDAQKNIMRQVLSENFGKVALISKVFDLEAKKYANQLSDIFKSAGWEVSPIREDLLDDFDGKINIFMTGTSSLSNTDVFTVASAPFFDKSNVPYVSEPPRIGSFGGSVQENTLYLEIGSK
jgi:hypothetical protein